MKKTANLLTPQRPPTHKVSISQVNQSQHPNLILEMNSYRAETIKRELKQLRVLLLVPSGISNKLLNVRLFKDQLRHLVKEVLAIKFQHNLEQYLAQYQPDLILALGSETMFPEENIPALKASNVPKAVWMADATCLTRTERNLALLFDYIFTQNIVNLIYYQGLQGKYSSYLPYATDTELYYPRRVENCYHSDVLILGHFQMNSVLHTLAYSELLHGLKVITVGSGWEPIRNFLDIKHDKDMSNYYNGARIVINCTGSVQQIMEVSACGVFQLVEDHPHLQGSRIAEEDLIRFQNFKELTESFKYYISHSEERRISASRALKNVKYNHSYLQQGKLLLNKIFTEP
ncbi:glycosyltransferase [Paenibacillus sp. FSL R10-2734]|uniref:glycosyltransferase family protein n=1 Tax=Paenibacillus sp. FSL R10-2734 TaxID=2954691 RepID=UPI0030DC8715